MLRVTSWPCVCKVHHFSTSRCTRSSSSVCKLSTRRQRHTWRSSGHTRSRCKTAPAVPADCSSSSGSGASLVVHACPRWPQLRGAGTCSRHAAALHAASAQRCSFKGHILRRSSMY